MSSWIKIREQRPKRSGTYIATIHDLTTDRRWVKSVWFDGSVFSGDDFSQHVTHWMELPELPVMDKVTKVVRDVRVAYEGTAFK